MEEQKNNLPVKLNLPPEQLTEAAIEAYFRKEISRKEYQEVLQKIDDINPDKTNLKESKKTLNEVNAGLTKFENAGIEVGKPYFKAHKAILAAIKKVLQPISAKVDIKQAAIKTINDELLADLAKEAAERAKIENIQNTMTAFINNCTNFIGTATSDTQLVNIQKRIGTEKSKIAFYGEFMDDLKVKCAALDPLINERKEQIRKANELLAAAADAAQKNDAEAAAEIKEQQEQLENDMEENILRLQEEAFQQISKDIPVFVPETTNEALNGRNYWRWEITDAKILYKKMPELILLEPNKEAIDKYMAENRNKWKEEGKNEVMLPGIKFFIKKYL